MSRAAKTAPTKSSPSCAIGIPEATGRAAAHPILPCGLHVAGGDRRHRLSEQGRDLRPSVQGLRRDDDHDRGRSKTPGRADRRDLRAAHLGIGAHPPSARPHDRSGRGHFLGRPEVGILSAGLLPAGARALAAVPPASPPMPPGACNSLARTQTSRTAMPSRNI